MKIKTADLIGPALDWAVATIEGYGRLRRNPHAFDQALIMNRADGQCVLFSALNYSTDWSFGGPIIERPQDEAQMGIEGRVGWAPGAKEFATFFRAWYGPSDDPYIVSYGPTRLIAAMRCFVASRLGDEVEVPEELVKNIA